MKEKIYPKLYMYTFDLVHFDKKKVN